ncbi:MAG: hypothetical protein HYV42_04285 [Candidatus Magasanikbacteria bacterium]|nr:hypothetical protein [Candidatus Magasanikbacteria bacterium]
MTKHEPWSDWMSEADAARMYELSVFITQAVTDKGISIDNVRKAQAEMDTISKKYPEMIELGEKRKRR